MARHDQATDGEAIRTVSYLLSMYPEFHETFVAREVEALRRTGADIAVYSLKAPAGAEHDLYPEHRAFLHQAGFLLDRRVLAANALQFVTSPVRYLSAIGMLIGLYRKRPAELVKALASFPKTVLFARSIRARGGILHAHWATIPAAMGLVINRLTSVPLSLTAHAWDIFLTPEDELRYKIARVNGVVTCTGFNVDHLKCLADAGDRDKIRLNYHGLDLARFEDRPAADAARANGGERPPLRALAVGRLVEQKGFVHMIRALKRMTGVGVELAIIGEGPLRQALEDEAKGLPDGVAVHFLGRRSHDETLRRMAEADVFVAPSVIAGNGDRDGIPNVILEAMASGAAIVGTAVSGIPEVVLDGETGLLIAPGEPEAIAEALRRLAEDPDARRRMGGKARRFVVERFDMDGNIDEFLGFLAEFHTAEPSAGP
ncbi:MAG: glycosyltransferase family 4 protein [Alphaproteobacteria bacterium]